MTADRTIEAALLPGAEERAMLRDSMRRFLETHWPVDAAVGRGREPDAIATVWSLLVGQGIATLGTDPTEGGLREIAILMEALGRAACPAPMLGAALANLAFGRSGEGAAAATGGAAAHTLLGRLHAGSARVCWSFGEFDPDADTAALAWHDDRPVQSMRAVDATARADADGAAKAAGRLDGTLRFVDGAGAATDLVIAVRRNGRSGLALVSLDAPGASIAATRALGADALSEIRLENAVAAFVAVDAHAIDDLLRIARVMALARAHGAARRAFELAVDYAKERRQFGQPIGRFQAIQHKLANGLIALEGVRLTLEHAAEAVDLAVPAWRYFADAAVAFGGPALRSVSLETHHAFGAIGYAEEHEAPRHFKRAHLDALAFGGAAAARRGLAAHLLDDPHGVVPQYDLGAAGNAFRAEVRAWLADHWSGARKAAFDAKPFHDREFDASFARDLGKTGWLGLGWPRAFGGQARSPLEQLAFVEVMERAEAPRIGAAVQANALMMHGTPEQQQRYLPEILRGEAMHGMGYSEPDAGSDLAALRTSATLERAPDGDRWVINGQKIWTTTWWGKYMFLAARTDRDAKPSHAGISMFIVPMDTPGITIKPATTMYDGSFANIFYDDVRIPADAIVGPVNGGWKVLTDALANERGWVGGGIVLKVAHAFDLLCHEVREAASQRPPSRDDALVRDRIATLAAEIEVGRRLMIHCAELATSGTTPPEMGAISKVFSGELMERFGEAALDILGPRAALSQGAAGALRNGRFEQGLRHSLMWVISIGTNEIQRSLIAQRGLGLPR
jgi:alkylation response protein AidB-like acyl-CoA dehydrogenase